MNWQFNSFAQTDLGLVREGNEDSAICGANLIAVAELVLYPTASTTSKEYKYTGLSEFALCIFCILLFDIQLRFVGFLR